MTKIEKNFQTKKYYNNIKFILHFGNSCKKMDFMR